MPTPSYTVPANGVITSFSMTTVSQNAGQKLDFQVFRPKGGGLYMVVGHTGAVTLVGTGGTETLSAHIATQAGDVLGVYDTTAVTNCISSGGMDTGVSGVSDPAVGTKIDLSQQSGPFSRNESATLVTDEDLALNNVPADITTAATGPAGATVNYASPTASDEGGQSPPVSCTPKSGSTFAVGTTTVTCTATATATDGDDANSPVSATLG
jgi:hypothetical protein